MAKISKLSPSVGSSKLGQTINKIIDILNSGDIKSNASGVNLSTMIFSDIGTGIDDEIKKAHMYVIDEENGFLIMFENIEITSHYISIFQKIKEHNIIIDKVRNKVVEDIDYSIYTIDEDTYNILNPDESIYKEAPEDFTDTKIENNKYILQNQLGKIAYKNSYYYCKFTAEWNENNINELYFKFFTGYIDLYNDTAIENERKFSETGDNMYMYYMLMNYKELNEGLVCVKSYIDPNIEEFIEYMKDKDLSDIDAMIEFYNSLNNEEKILYKSALTALMTGIAPYKTDIIYDNVEENIKSMNNYFFYPT